MHYIPYRLSDCFDFLADFQDEIIKNLNEDLPLSIPVIKFISNDQSNLFQFEEFLYKEESPKKYMIKIALQLIDSILKSRQFSNYKKLHELLSFLKDDLISLFKSNELIDIFINDKQSIFILYELELITIRDIIAIPFTTQSKPSHFLLSNNENIVSNTKNIPKNNQNSLIRRSFSTSASIFNVNSNFSPNSNIRSSTNTNFKLSGNHSSVSSSGFNLSSRKMSLDYSSSQKMNSNNNGNNNTDPKTPKFEFSGSPNEEIVSLFHPEIENFDSKLIQLFPNLFDQSKKILENDKKIFLDYRRKFQNENPIVQSIINDNVEELHKLLSNSNIDNIDSITITHSIFERIEFINDKQNPPKILELAAFFGSVKIFKFLLLDLRGNSSSSSLPPLHFYQQQQLQQREQLIKQQREQLYNLQSKQSGSQIGLIQIQQQLHIQKQQEQLMKYQAQYQSKFQQQQSQFQQQQQKLILDKMPERLHLFAVAGGNAEIIHILEQEGFLSDDKKTKEAAEISILFHQNKIFDYLIEKNNIEPSIDMIITCVKSCNYYCFLALFDMFHSKIVCEINKKGKNGENILQMACALGRLLFAQFINEIDYDLENKLINKKENSNQSNLALNVNVRDPNGFSPLHLAAAGGHIEIIQYLVFFYNKKKNVSDVQVKSQPKSPFPKIGSLENSPSPRPKPISPIINHLGKSQIINVEQNSSILKSSQILTPSISNTDSISKTTSLNLNTNSTENSKITNLNSNPLDSLQTTANLATNSTENSNPLESLPDKNLTTSSNLVSTNQNMSSSQKLISPTSNSNTKSAPSSPKLVTLPSSNFLSSKSTSIRRKINANTVSFSKTVSLGSLSFSPQTNNASKLNLNVKDFKGKSSAQIGYENGFSNVSKFLVTQNEFEINSRDDSGIALIHIASMKNDLEFLVFMTKKAKNRIDLNIETKKSKKTAFLIAASNGNVEMVKYLIGLDSVNKKCRDFQGQMAHHITCDVDNKKKIKDVVKNDDERREYYIKQYTDYYLMNNIKLNNTENKQNISNNYLENIESDKHNDSFNKDEEIINDKNDDENNEINNNNDKNNNDNDKNDNSLGNNICNDHDLRDISDDFFHCSNLEVLQFLVDNHGFDVNDKDISKKTPLHHACIIGDFGIVKYLTTVNGIDINARDVQGQTPLVHAFLNDNLTLAKFLLESTDANIRVSDNDGRNSLHLSAQGGHYENVTYIFSLQDQIKQRNRGKTATNRHQFSSFSAENDSENEGENESYESNEELDINGADNYGRTCLHLSFESGNTELIKFVLNRKDVDLNARDKGGRSLLHFAASFNYMFVIQFLESQGPIPRKISYGYGGGYSGFNSGYGRSTNRFDMKNINAKANHDWTALHFAAAAGFVEMCQFLVSVKYVNANARDSTGMTPLHLSVQYEKVESVRFLINVKEVYVNSQDNEGRTPLHLACSMGQVEIIKMLVNCKEIDLSKLDKKSQTAFKHLTVEYQKSLAYLFKNK